MVVQKNLNTKRLLAAVCGMCAGMAVLLGFGDVSTSDFGRYLLASDDAGAGSGASSSDGGQGRVLKTLEEPSRPMRILKVEKTTASDHQNKDLIYLKPASTSRSLKGSEGASPSKSEVLRRVKEMVSNLGQHAVAPVGGMEDNGVSRNLHTIQLEFPDCVGLNETDCEALIMEDLQTNEALLSYLGGSVEEMEFDVRIKRHEDDTDHAKVVIVTDETGTQVVGNHGDCIVHYPFHWHVDGVEIAIGPWDCSVGSHHEEGSYPVPLTPEDCCSLILSSIGGECDDSGDCLECFIQTPDEPNKHLIVIVVDTTDPDSTETEVVEDAVPHLLASSE